MASREMRKLRETPPRSSLRDRPLSLVILIVTYKVDPPDSETLQSVRNWIDANPDPGFEGTWRLVVWDNSPNSRLEDVRREVGIGREYFEYVSTPQNLSLSEIYNSVITSLKPDDYLLILDQDTSFPPSFIPCAMAQAREGRVLVLPQVVSAGSIVSPARRFACRGRLQQSWTSGEIASRNLVAINSGMLIAAKVFGKYRYHADLRFYGTDTWFMVNFEQHFATAYVLPIQLQHKLHMDSAPTDSWRRAYFQEQIRVNRIIFDRGYVEKLTTFVYNLYLRIFHARR